MGPPLGPEGGRDYYLRAGEAGKRMGGWIENQRARPGTSHFTLQTYDEDSDSHTPGSKLRWRFLTVLSNLSIKWG